MNIKGNFCQNTGSMTTESERQTRAQRIDPRLKAVGWNIALFTAEAAA